MQRNITVLLAFVLALSLGVVARAGDGDQKSKDRTSGDPARFDGQQQAQQQQTRPGFVLIEERLIYVLANEPQLHMASALAKLAENDNRAAAEEIRIAANYVEMQGNRGEGDVSQKLSKNAEKLRKLADKVESGELKDKEKLSKTFAKANLELARHHNALAKSFLQNDRYVAAGYDLDAAATNLRQAVVWSGEQPNEEIVALIRNADEVSTALTRESIHREMTDDEDAQPAAARERGTDSPITGTTEAEAQNVAEHAREVTKKLSDKIDQFASKLEESKDRDPSERSE